MEGNLSDRPLRVAVGTDKMGHDWLARHISPLNLTEMTNDSQIVDPIQQHLKALQQQLQTYR